MAKTTLVIMAAGIGSRFGGGIKQLTPVGPGGEIIMDYSIYDAREAGFDEVIFIIRKDLEKDFKEIIGDRIEKILPVVDNFERGLATVSEEKKEDPFVDGMNRIYRQLLTELENMGVKPIEAVGQEFDPNLHNAVMQVESEEYESGTVAQELQKGYTYRDSVVRHSMVAVVM